jgi:undecaprenyl diphosphate synthase
MKAAQQLGEEGTVPAHVAVIMDGNGRWARSRGLPRVAGHRAGAEAVRRTIVACRELGVTHLTLFAFSSENWKRPADEVDDLMGLLRFYIRKEIDELNAQGVAVRFIGSEEGLADDIKALMHHTVEITRDNRLLNVTVALNYGSRDEMCRAVRALARDVAGGKLAPDDIDEAAIAARLDTVGIPDPDLIVRTSGEQRLSNFLLWQAAYAELVFSPVMWPDFDKDALVAAIGEYQRRERRYGARVG